MKGADDVKRIADTLPQIADYKSTSKWKRQV